MYIEQFNKSICPQCSSPAKEQDGTTFRCTNPKCGTVFPSMNIFISYGHPESVICKRILEALKARGHRPWFDEEQISHGQDWRDKIAKGIENSNGVLSFLSKHSVRDPGVCLDELSIAIGVRGGNIKTILLEPETDVRPPASVCHLQWLDMSDWQARYQEDVTKFEEWFQQKMQQLFAVIESPESLEFTGQISSIREKLYIASSSARQRYLLKQFFVGREWLTEQLESWLDNPKGERLCVLYGDPGVGKSAFAAHYIHYNPRVAAWLFCEYDQPHYSDAKTVIMTLAFQLACRVPGYRRALLGMLDQETQLMALSSSELFNRLLTEPLTRYIDGGHETLCVVVDGLDESSSGERNVLADTLGRMAELLPKWLRILVTARKVSSVTDAFRGCFQIDLRGGLEQNLTDVKAYFTETLGERFGLEPDWETALDALVERSGGIFLYAKLVSDGILNDKLSIHDPSGFPQGLSKAFYEWFRWYFPDGEEYRRDFCRPLGVIMASPEPLPRAELCRIFPDWDENNVHWFMNRILVFLQEDENDFGEKTLAFTHRYISEWLEREDNATYGSSRSAAVQTMAKRFYALFKEDADKLTPFEALYLAELLNEIGMKKKWQEVMLNYDVFWKILDAGDHCGSWGKLDQERTYYEKAKSIAETMCQERNELDDRRVLSICYDRIADVISRQGDRGKAFILYEKSLDISEELVEKRGTAGDYRALGLGYLHEADVLSDQSRLGKERALALYGNSLSIYDLLVQKYGDPDDFLFLGMLHDHIANVLSSQGKLEDALTMYKMALKITEVLVKERGTQEERRNLAISRHHMADALRSQGKWEQALALYRKSLAVTEELVKEKPSPDDYLELSVCYDSIGKTQKDQGEWGQALVMYKKAIDILEGLVEKRRDKGERRALGMCYNDIANVLSAQGRLEQALALYEKSMAISEELVEEGGAPGDYLDLGLSYQNVATALLEQGELEKALTRFEKALTILQESADLRGTVDAYDALTIVLYNMSPHQKDRRERKNLIQRGLAISKKLYQQTRLPRYKTFCDAFLQLQADSES